MNIAKFYNNLSDKEKKLFHITIGVVVIAMFDALYFRPIGTQIKMLDERIQQAKDGLKRDLKLLSYRDKIMTEARALEDYDTAEGRTNDEEIIAEFLKSVERMVSESGVNLIRLNPLDVNNEAGWRLYQAEMTAEGKTEDILRLLHRVSTSMDLLSVRRFSLTRKKTAPDTLTLVGTLGRMVVDPESLPRPVEEELRAQGIALTASDDDLSDKTSLSSRIQTISSEDNETARPSSGHEPGRPAGVVSTEIMDGKDQQGESKEQLQSGRFGTRSKNDIKSEGRRRLQNTPPSPNNATGSSPSGSSSPDEIGGSGGGGVGGQGTVSGVSDETEDRTRGPSFVQGERIRIKSLGELWREFWGFKPKPADVDETIEGQTIEDNDSKEPARRNLWERLFKGR